MTKKIRKLIIDIAYKNRTSHTGSALSLVEILEAIYFHASNLTLNNLSDPARDRVILSKGHGSLALYATLALKGIIPLSFLDEYQTDNGILPGHIDMRSAAGLEVSTGSLGHGPGLGEGIALSNRIKNIKAKIYIIIGDGEFQEGSVYEAMQSISFHNLNEITIILDNNRFQGSDRTNNVVHAHKFQQIFEALGFFTITVDGHNTLELTKALTNDCAIPKAIIANTIKGKGVPFFEDQLSSHYLKLDEAHYLEAINNLGCV